MCMIAKGSLWFAAIEIMDFNASNEESLHTDLADRHFVNSLAPIRDLICTGSHSNGLFVSIHFVSTGVT